MLGKTNITMVKGGAIASDIAEYSWDNISIGEIKGDFVNAIYENNTLIAVTTGGDIVFTNDGENWEKRRLGLEDDYRLNDMIWDGERFVFVGSHTDNKTYISGLVAMSENLTDFEIKTNVNDEDYFGLNAQYMSFLGIILKDGQYSVIYAYLRESGTSMFGQTYYMVAAVTDLKSFATKMEIGDCPTYYKGSVAAQCMNLFNGTTLKLSKKAGKIIMYIKCLAYASSGSYITNPTDTSHNIFVSSNGIVFSTVLNVEGKREKIEDIFSVFESKDSFYYMSTSADYNYKLVKLSGNLDELIMTTNIDFGFIDAVYFNKCEIFINGHQMLIVRPGEKLIDKLLGDLTEITYDFSMTSIVKAFNKLYIFGTEGSALVSSDEIKNEEALAVKTMSASKALYDAKTYTDEKYMALEARITALETAGV